MNRAGFGFFTSTEIFQKVTDKSRWDSKFFKKVTAKCHWDFKSPLFVADFWILLKKSLSFQKSTDFQKNSSGIFLNSDSRLPPGWCTLIIIYWQYTLQRTFSQVFTLNFCSYRHSIYLKDQCTLDLPLSFCLYPCTPLSNKLGHELSKNPNLWF